MAADRQQRLKELRESVDAASRMRGWKFNLRKVRLGPETPWDYVARARELARRADSMLDMGTGGGERFSEICRGYRGLAVATEGWPPNITVAASRLMSMGIAVVHAFSPRLPFRDASFDLVLNRHEELDTDEVTRVISPGGRLFTQQIGANFWKELLEFFPRARPGSGRLFERYVRGLENAGLVITRAEEHDTNVAFRSLGDLGYMLAVTPWTIPGFDLDRDLDTLLALERSLKRDDGIVLTEGFFAIEARKDTVKDR